VDIANNLIIVPTRVCKEWHFSIAPIAGEMTD